MLTYNMNVRDGLVNGLIGQLQYIEYNDNCIYRIWLKFLESWVGKKRRDKHYNTIMTLFKKKICARINKNSDTFIEKKCQ